MYCSLRRGHFACILLALGFTGCQQKVDSTPPRYAVVRFENLSGDVSLDWVGRAAEEVLSRGLDHTLPGPVLTLAALNRVSGGTISSERARALAAGATHLISGYLQVVNGKVRLNANDEDLSTHRITRDVAAEATEPVAAIRQLATAFSPSAKSALTSNPLALKLYSAALDEPAERALPDLQEATRLDPRFGAAWVSLVNYTILKGDRTATIGVAEAALTQQLDPVDLATVHLEKATLENDKVARIAAMREISRLTPADVTLLKSLAESEAVLGQFAQSAADWKRLTGYAPDDRDAWNQRGYALAWSGDFSAAMDAMKAYAARWPDDPNPLDSTGDVCYMYGKFADAASWYLKANAKSAQLLNGGDLYKAAWAQFRAGDKTKADATFAQFKAAREKANTSAVSFEADWLYRTGRRKEAESMLRKESDSAAPATASALWSQLVIWDLMAGDRSAAAKDAAIEATKPPSNISAVARFSALPSATPPEWQARAEHLIQGVGVDAARRYTLGVALILDGKKDAALAVWRAVVEDATATDFFARAVLAKLKGEKPKLELVPDSVNLNQLNALADLP